MAADDFASAPFLSFLSPSPSGSSSPVPLPLPLSRALLLARDGPGPPLRTRTSHYSSPPSSVYSPTPSEAGCSGSSMKRQRAWLTPAQLVSHGRKNIARPFPLPRPPPLTIVEEASELGKKVSLEALLSRKTSRDGSESTVKVKQRRKRSENDLAKPKRSSKSKSKTKLASPPPLSDAPIVKGFISAPVRPRPTTTPLAEVCSFNFTVGEVEDVFGPSVRAPRATGFPAPLETVWEKRERKKLRELTRKLRALRLDEPDNG